ncbi:Uncharacterised protein [Shigella sonnei]|nr:hypothetical protein C4A70_01175 [Escherichia coli]CSE48885.1 Uncharacterised protein [Shigella sonnei]CSG08335.1 Uncharacterised protein [Shigella sonnei]CSW10519.1 Uncharacterised protein [Shigella sonnei]
MGTLSDFIRRAFLQFQTKCDLVSDGAVKKLVFRFLKQYANLCRALAVFQVFHRLLLQHNRTGCGRKKTCHYS